MRKATPVVRSGLLLPKHLESQHNEVADRFDIEDEWSPRFEKGSATRRLTLRLREDGVTLMLTNYGADEDTFAYSRRLDIDMEMFGVRGSPAQSLEAPIRPSRIGLRVRDTISLIRGGAPIDPAVEAGLFGMTQQQPGVMGLARQ